MGLKGFVEGGIASVIAGCSTHPLDLIKVRMQLQGESAAAVAPPIASLRPPSPSPTPPPPDPSPPEPGPAPRSPPPRPDRGRRADPPLRGPRAVLSLGVSATVLRQTLYSTTRMGLYDVFKTRWSDESGRFPLPRKIAAGLLAGGIGAAVGNPADVAMVRMQADGRLPAAERRNPVRRRRDLAHGAGRGGRVPLARELADGEPRDDRHREPAVDVRPGEGEHTAEGGDGGRAGDARGGQPGGGAGGGGGVEPGGRGEDEGDEHEGGEGDAAAVRGGARLRDEDGEGGGADGPVQGVRPHGVAAGAVHRGAVRDARAGAEAAQGLLSAPELELGGGRSAVGRWFCFDDGENCWSILLY
ncbi:putative mitochondrial uncoupling protein 5 [Iris pallida]|uniref:Mitochondrial uncoupling protein 5 n=1 Tax=Iris pallida TaxID=29817 RepID=A0AAX6IAJ5_IRIPA|nr:putative mitochondrial uncoupling protein 5 [Iris pallida]